MKTVFKKGMEVYDQVNKPNKKGKILDIKENEFCKKIHFYDYPIEVQFEGEDDLSYYDFEGCPVWGTNPTLSTKPYTLQGFEQKAPVPTYEDIVKDKNYIYLPKNLVAPNKELADAVVALLKLLFLRDYYNEGWQPDFSKETKNTKYCISKDASGRFMKYDYYNYDFNNVLIFKSKQIRSKFWDEQLELMKIAKPLL